MILFESSYHNARLVVFDNHEVHFDPLSQPFIAPVKAVRDFMKLKKSLGRVYTKHAITDDKTPRFNMRLGFREVKRDFAFVYYETEGD